MLPPTTARAAEPSPDPAPQPWSCEAPYQLPTYSRPADDSVALGTLIDAAGYAVASNSDWVDLSAGNFCGGPGQELVLLKNKHSNFSILGGPVPYAIGAGDLISSSAHAWRTVTAGNLDGGGFDEIVAVRNVTSSGVPDVVVARVNETSCEVSSVIATATVGNPANSEWEDAAVGRFDRSGTPWIVLLKQAHANFVVLQLNGSSLSVVASDDLDSSSSSPWRALGAGDLDGDGFDELIAAREVSDGQGETVLVYRWNGDGFVRTASSTVGNNGNSDWSSLAVGDFNADGRAAIALVKDQHSNFIVLDLEAGNPELRVVAAEDLDSTAGQTWRGLVATDWLAGADLGAAELVAARAAEDPYRADLFVYGNPFHRVARDSGLANLKSQWDQNRGGTVEQQKEWLRDTHTNTVGWTLIEAGDYNKLVEFLEATKDFCIDGKQLRVTVSPDNPNLHPSVCALPQNSEITALWNELDYFTPGSLGIFDACSMEVEIDGPGPEPIVQNVKCDYCRDYLAWSSLIGRLAQDYPHLVSMGIDDLVYYLGQPFDGDYVAEMESRLRSQAPWMNFAPSLYYHGKESDFFGDEFPDVAKTFDTFVFYFRNNKQGTGPCSDCTNHTGGGACLDGECAEATIPNLADEVGDMAAMLPDGRKINVGVYYSGHSSLGEPSVRYDYDITKLILAMPWLGGVTVYTMQAPGALCMEGSHLIDKYCAVQKAFGEAVVPVIHTDLTAASPGAPDAAGNPYAYSFPALGAQNVVFRDSDGNGWELWRTAWGIGHSNLTSLGQAPKAVGDLSAYLDPAGNQQVVLYRNASQDVHSLYWSTGAVGHDNLTGTSGPPDAEGNPIGYYTAFDGFNHVIYRDEDDHLIELYWTGIGAVGSGDLTVQGSAPNAQGDPSAYVDTNHHGNVVAFRGSDNHVHTLYWESGPVGHDNLSAVAGTPLAAGDPHGYYTAHNDSHQVVYRGTDGHVHELWWVGVAPVSGWDLSAVSGAPAAESDPVGYYAAGSNTKHVFYRSADGHLHEIWWTPGGGMPLHRSLTLFSSAPLAAGRPTAYYLASDGSHHVIYRGNDGHLHELAWSS
ncbi:MAG TPA: FG-GAP-like repeat-containing protein [Thermoanaerobaculia bacterium]|nr:FG-GAP-like repeat-containing protein [Thermoanaerobaculia bacterium]